MKKPLKILFGSALLASSSLALSAATQVQAQSTRGGNICLNVTEILSSQAVDNQTIVYRMKDGKVWRNTLAAPCPDLVSHAAGAYSQRLHTDYLCANTQHITVQTGMVCRLGEFTRVN
jgi:hypothetical protein